MADYTEDPEDNPTEIGLEHRAQALRLLNTVEPHMTNAEAIAAAQVHATLALANVQMDSTRLLAIAAHELNAMNLFKLADTLTDDHPLRTIIHNGMLQHLSKEDGPLHTDIMLQVRIQELALEIKAGDDIVVGNRQGTKIINLLVIDPDKDEWLLLGSDATGTDNTPVNSPRIHALFDDDIRSLTVTLKDSPHL